MSGSAAIFRLTNVLQLTLSRSAFSPVVTGSLLWLLLKGPEALRSQLVDRIAALRDPQKFARIVKALKSLLFLGLLGKVNSRLNDAALNGGRWRSGGWNNWPSEIAVVTGGCSGIGALTVRGLVRRGMRVVVLDVQKLPVGLEGNPLISFYECDITNASAVTSAAERIRADVGVPTILVNNAGIAEAHTILNTSEAYLRKIFDVNVLSNWFTVKAFLPDMVARNKGHIVTVASTASYVGVGGMADYTATKAAVLAFHESLAQEIKLHYNAPRILTTSIHPNWVRTPLIKPYEAELDKAGAPIIEPQVVADAVVKQILAARGAQVFLPTSVATASLVRSMPNWIQESVRTTTSLAVRASST